MIETSFPRWEYGPLPCGNHPNNLFQWLGWSSPFICRHDFDHVRGVLGPKNHRILGWTFQQSPHGSWFSALPTSPGRLILQENYGDFSKYISRGNTLLILAGGTQTFHIFSPILKGRFQFDEHIFQLGWFNPPTIAFYLGTDHLNSPRHYQRWIFPSFR